MPEHPAYLRHDQTALYAFIGSIVEGVAARRSCAAYSPAAIHFLDFIADLAASSQKYLSEWSVADSEEFEDRREDLGTIRAAWKELHLLIKPALDADTLQVPSAVIDGIVRRFHDLPECAGTDFALFHTSEFNYVQVRTADLKRISAKVKKLILDAPEFPPDLGLIGIPYSQGRTAFANCLVAHEMGHYKYRGTKLESSLKARIDAAFKSLPGNSDQKPDDASKDALIKRLTLWAEEIFCDLFGVMLIGPCYTYAYIEAYDLSAVLDYSGLISDERFLPRLQFYDTYPSHMFRIQQQSLLLRGLSWWDCIEKNCSRSSTLLNAIQGIPIETHIKENPTQGKYIPLLDAILPDIKEAIGEAFDGVDDEFVSFSRLNPTVQNYLANGVVPSTLNVPIGKGTGEVMTVTASPLVLLNSGMEFYLTHLDDLIRSIPGEDEKRFDCRLHWIRRIEEWIAKAIEDESLKKEVSDVNPNGNGNPGPPQA
jgi:hypothetical protein